MKSVSPFGNIVHYELNDDDEVLKINKFIDPSRKTVVIQGLGFVGAAMTAALSSTRDHSGRCLYNVISIDLPDEKNYWKISLTNQFIPPVVTTDKKLLEAYETAGKEGNLMATYSKYAYAVADIIVIDIHLDIKKKELGHVHDYEFTYESYEKALETIAEKVKEEVLIIVETTVPPGTTEKVIHPLFLKAFQKRGLDSSKLYIAHSYERVMPGPNYYDSIVNFYRVYAGIDESSKEMAGKFLESFINTKDFPLTVLHSTTASEISKVLENSFRAMNIAFINEWAEFAQSSDVNLFEVIDAIRVRPTHKNIMQPGFGVGGYCLTKDALLADWSYRNHYHHSDHLNMSIKAIQTNDLMPADTFALLKKHVPVLRDKTITILGISYLSDVSDTRYSPTEYFYNLCTNEKATVNVHDPLVSYWEEKCMKINSELNSPQNNATQLAVFTVKHKEYKDLTTAKIVSLFPYLEILVDANNVISDQVARELSEKGIKIIGIGKGHWNKF